MKLKDACPLEEKLWPTCCCCYVASVMSNSVQPQRLQPTRLCCPWDSPGKNTGVGCHFLLQYDLPRWHMKKQRYYFASKAPSSLSYGFSSSHVWIWELEHKENWMLKNWCFWTVVLKKTLESPSDWKETKPVHPKGNQSWIFVGRTDAETETPILWPPDGKNWLERSWCWESLKVGGQEDKRGWDGWMASLTWWAWVWAGSVSWWWTAWHDADHGVTKSQTWLGDWTELIYVDEGMATHSSILVWRILCRWFLYYRVTREALFNKIA